jgi:hypothetical protein
MKTRLILSILCLFVFVNTQAQQRKAPTGTKVYTPPTQTTTTTPAPQTPKPTTLQEATKKQADYDSYQATQERTYSRPKAEKQADFGSVVKLNFLGIILGNVSMDYEKRLGKKSSLILTGGYYAFKGIGDIDLTGNFRAGLDYRQYLGKSYSPKGLFVSLGAVGNFFPYKSINSNTSTSGGTVLTTSSSSTESQIWLNVRALIGYQFLTGHFTIEGALGPAYGFLMSTEQKNFDATGKIGFLPAGKLSIGYAF